MPRAFRIALIFTSLLVFSGLVQAQVDEGGARQLVQLMNQERAGQGIQPLAVDQRLTEAACKHTEFMAAHEVVSHQFDGEPALEIRFAAENLHSNQQAENIDLDKDVASADKSFMHSPEHRANILNPNYNAVGVCVIRKRGHVYVTEDFAHRLREYSEPEADAALQQAVETYATTHGMPAPVRKPQAQLRQMACDMAANDSLQKQKLTKLRGVRAAAAWTTPAPGELPKVAGELLSHPMPSGYSLGACFAPSASQPGGVYWVVMVVY